VGVINMENNFDSIVVEDSENYSSNSLGIKEIALEAYRKCFVEGSKEMTKGGVSTKIINGKIIRIDIPNQREIFINCVRGFGVLLTPFLLNKDKYLNEANAIQNSISDLKKEGHEKYQEARANNKSVEELKEIYELALVDLNWELMSVYSRLLDDISYLGEGSGYFE
jgi:hypothetical protein